jgi:hypothetical protein
MLPTNTVGLDKLVNMAASGLLGNTAAGAVTALTPAQVYAQINNSGFVHTDNTKVGCIGLVWITSGSGVLEYPSGSFAVGTSGGTRYLRSTAGTWTVVWASVNNSGAISSGSVAQITTTSTTVVIGVNVLFAVGVRTA